MLTKNTTERIFYTNNQALPCFNIRKIVISDCSNYINIIHQSWKIRNAFFKQVKRSEFEEKIVTQQRKSRCTFFKRPFQKPIFQKRPSKIFTWS